MALSILNGILSRDPGGRNPSGMSADQVQDIRVKMSIQYTNKLIEALEETGDEG